MEEQSNRELQELIKITSKDGQFGFLAELESR